MTEKPKYEKSVRWSTKERILWLERILGGDKDSQAVELAICKKDPWHFLIHHVVTEDAHSKSKPFQPFPDKPHLFYLTRLWQTERMLLCPKSRQVSATWLFSALYMWDAIFFPSRLTFFVSKKEEGSHDNLERVNTMYERLPKFIRDFSPGEHKGGSALTYCKFSLKNRSKLIGVPAGADQLRQYTASGIFSDEAAFQEELKNSIAAALPTLGKNGRITMVSSASPSAFSDYVFDLE